jgi:hypothetical protein
MAIEIFDHGNCKAAGRFFGSNGGEGNPFEAGASLHAQGVRFKSVSGTNDKMELTLDEHLGFDEFIGLCSCSGDRPGFACIVWEDEATFFLQYNIAAPPEASIDFIVFRLVKTIVPFTPAPPSIPT